MLRSIGDLGSTYECCVYDGMARVGGSNRNFSRVTADRAGERGQLRVLGERSLIEFPGPPQLAEVMIYGAGGHAQVVADAALSMGLKVYGFCADDASGHPRSVPLLAGVQAVGRDGFINGPPVVVAIGANDKRRLVVGLLPGPFVSVVHRSAQFGMCSEIGDGSMLLHGITVGNYVSIGAHVIVNTAATINEQVVIEPFAHVAPHALIGAGSVICEGVLVGAGAIVAPGVVIGEWATIGAGTIVTADIPPLSTAVGVPCRILAFSKSRNRVDMQAPPIA